MKRHVEQTDLQGAVKGTLLLLNLNNCHHLSLDQRSRKLKRCVWSLCKYPWTLSIQNYGVGWGGEVGAVSFSPRSSKPVLIWKQKHVESQHTAAAAAPQVSEQKLSHTWCAFISRTAKQRVTSTGDPGNCMILSAAAFSSANLLCHPFKHGFKSDDLLHLICKWSWTVSELTFAVWFMLSCLSLCDLVFHFECRIQRAEGHGYAELLPSSTGKTAGSSDPRVSTLWTLYVFCLELCRHQDLTASAVYGWMQEEEDAFSAALCLFESTSLLQ